MLPFVKAGGEMPDKVRTDEEMQAHLMRVGLLCTQWAYSRDVADRSLVVSRAAEHARK